MVVRVRSLSWNISRGDAYYCFDNLECSSAVTVMFYNALTGHLGVIHRESGREERRNGISNIFYCSDDHTSNSHGKIAAHDMMRGI